MPCGEFGMSLTRLDFPLRYGRPSRVYHTLVQRIRFIDYDKFVCDTSKGSLYIQIKPPVVSEHAFLMTEVVCQSTRIANCDSSGIMSE